jgi:hypothetical protein
MSIPYVRDDVESFLGTCVPEVSSVYFETRLKAVQKAVREDSLEDIFSPGILEEHLQHLHTLCRHRYDRTYQLIQSVVEPLLAQYQDGLQIMQRNAGAQMPDEFKYHLALVESKLIDSNIFSNNFQIKLHGSYLLLVQSYLAKLPRVVLPAMSKLKLIQSLLPWFLQLPEWLIFA